MTPTPDDLRAAGWPVAEQVDATRVRAYDEPGPHWNLRYTHGADARTVTQRQLDGSERSVSLPAGPVLRPDAGERGDGKQRRRIMNRAEVFEAVDRERAWQEHKWGTVTEHPHTVGEWLLIVEAELAEAKQGWVKGNGDADALRELVQVAAVAIAALEQHGALERPWTALGLPDLARIRWNRTLTEAMERTPR